jgi:hypothetical protein
MIQDGLGESIYDISDSLEHTLTSSLAAILRKSNAPSTKIPMNYAQYENKIVELLAVALDGWPLPGRVCNPGNLNSNDMNILSKALTRGMCKWITLTPEEVSARKLYNQQCVANGEQVYGPPRKRRAQNVTSESHGGGNNNSDDDE